MFIIENAESFLYLALGLSALIIAIAITWTLRSILNVINDVRSITEKTKNTLTAAHDIAVAAKEKLHDTSLQLSALTTAATALKSWIEKNHKSSSDSDSKQA